MEVRLSVFLRRLLVLFFLPFLLIACAQQKLYVNDIELQQKLLPFLEDGKTRKKEVESKLDRPFIHYEDGRIWVYALEITEEGPFEVYRFGDYHLVLVFDEKNILIRHSLLRIKP